MTAHGAEPEHPESLAFFCRDCDLVFVSLPDGTGYEQAKCPKCHEICVTVEFERQERERHRNEATFFSFLGAVTGLFHLHADSYRREQPHASESVAIARYEHRLDAEKDADVLVRQGIEASLEVVSPGRASWFGGSNVPVMELKVPACHALRAAEILHETDAPLPEEKTRLSMEDVSFECEECGKMIAFPGQRRGKVETCPHCHEYVDVPD